MGRKTKGPDKDSRVAEKEKIIDQQLGYFYEGGRADVRLAR